MKKKKKMSIVFIRRLYFRNAVLRHARTTPPYSIAEATTSRHRNRSARRTVGETIFSSKSRCLANINHRHPRLDWATSVSRVQQFAGPVSKI